MKKFILCTIALMMAAGSVFRAVPSARAATLSAPYKAGASPVSTETVLLGERRLTLTEQQSLQLALAATSLVLIELHARLANPSESIQNVEEVNKSLLAVQDSIARFSRTLAGPAPVPEGTRREIAVRPSPTPPRQADLKAVTKKESAVEGAPTPAVQTPIAKTPASEPVPQPTEQTASIAGTAAQYKKWWPAVLVVIVALLFGVRFIMRRKKASHSHTAQGTAPAKVSPDAKPL